ncbi:unnamed protein product (macronuclear) [Paramecium tetraurelia]|uniref:Uncharacterized protein n=1 Tax=Paramecium tetraurelia TaxID=5888 RepID=A0DPT2_PARTE|nr:uncharacterized protein GSPATT00019231001 [Paramecium tetraurelia]CAK85049.1 unnamed protein product [Paramecium tetraurelia]|eukprot:XP_001452446.1 hypothetical protein (macronuclear) [Paramecium tetraurelia strain d4-2]
MNTDLDQKTIDQIVDKKLALMEAEYEMFKKYDNPNYKGADYPVDQINNLNNDNQQQENQDEKGKEENLNLEEEDEFQEYQGYEKMEENSDKEEEDEINYDQVEHVDPFAKPLDVDLIKKCMAEIQLPTPAWAQSFQGWEQKLSQMKSL